jgi:hypothetical protein
MRAARKESAMPKQSEPQKRTVERVMHEFKHGELESGSGRKVGNRRQAVAIALSEAGASNRESPQQNRKTFRRTKSRERAAGRTKSELYAEARRKEIPGRSKMSQAELEKAVRH